MQCTRPLAYPCNVMNKLVILPKQCLCAPHLERLHSQTLLPDTLPYPALVIPRPARAPPGTACTAFSLLPDTLLYPALVIPRPARVPPGAACTEAVMAGCRPSGATTRVSASVVLTTLRSRTRTCAAALSPPSLQTPGRGESTAAPSGYGLHARYLR